MTPGLTRALIALFGVVGCGGDDVTSTPDGIAVSMQTSVVPGENVEGSSEIRPRLPGWWKMSTPASVVSRG